MATYLVYTRPPYFITDGPSLKSEFLFTLVGEIESEDTPSAVLKALEALGIRRASIERKPE